MKAKKMCMMIATVFAIAITTNALAGNGSCPMTGSSQRCKQKMEKKATAKCKMKEEKEDEDIQLSQVPDKIKKSAEKAVPGIKLIKAEIEDGIYELKGYVGNEKYKIKVTQKGKVIKIMKKKDDDDDENGENDDD